MESLPLHSVTNTAHALQRLHSGPYSSRQWRDGSGMQNDFHPTPQELWNAMESRRRQNHFDTPHHLAEQDLVNNLRRLPEDPLPRQFTTLQNKPFKTTQNRRIKPRPKETALLQLRWTYHQCCPKNTNIETRPTAISERGVKMARGNGSTTCYENKSACKQAASRYDRFVVVHRRPFGQRTRLRWSKAGTGKGEGQVSAIAVDLGRWWLSREMNRMGETNVWLGVGDHQTQRRPRRLSCAAASLGGRTHVRMARSLSTLQ